MQKTLIIWNHVRRLPRVSWTFFRLKLRLSKLGQIIHPVSSWMFNLPPFNICIIGNLANNLRWLAEQYWAIACWWPRRQEQSTWTRLMTSQVFGYAALNKNMCFLYFNINLLQIYDFRQVRKQWNINRIYLDTILHYLKINAIHSLTTVTWSPNLRVVRADPFPVTVPALNIWTNEWYNCHSFSLVFNAKKVLSPMLEVLLF